MQHFLEVFYSIRGNNTPIYVSIMRNITIDRPHYYRFQNSTNSTLNDPLNLSRYLIMYITYGPASNVGNKNTCITSDLIFIFVGDASTTKL